MHIVGVNRGGSTAVRVWLTVPMNDRTERALSDIQSLLMEQCGGCTTIENLQTSGLWRGPRKDVVDRGIAVVWSDLLDRSKLDALLIQLGRILVEECGEHQAWIAVSGVNVYMYGPPELPGDLAGLVLDQPVQPSVDDDLGEDYS